MDPSTSNGVPVNKLTDTFENFKDWLFRIQCQLQDSDLWTVCIKEFNVEDQNEKIKDEKAKAKIGANCPQSMIPIIRSAKTAYEMIKRLNVHAHGGIKERLRLIKELLSNQYKGNMNEYVEKVLATKEDLQGMGAPVDDGFLAMFMLAGLPEGFEHVVTTLDEANSQITSEMVAEALQKEGDRAVPGTSASQQNTAPTPEDVTCATCGLKCTSIKGLKRHITMSKGACSSHNAGESAASATPPKRAKPTEPTTPRPSPATASTSAATSPSTPAPSLQQTHTIRRLALYSTQWTIKARVTYKSDILSSKKKKRAGKKYFHVDMRDDSGVIRAVAFDDVIHRFYDLIQVDKWYYISCGRVKQTEKKFKEVDNDNEIVLSSNTRVVECVGDES